MHLTLFFRPYAKLMHLVLKYLAVVLVILLLMLRYWHKVRWVIWQMELGVMQVRHLAIRSQAHKCLHHYSKYLYTDFRRKNLIKIWRSLQNFILIGLALTAMISSVVIIYNIISIAVC